jgi:hypothetical protein
MHKPHKTEPQIPNLDTKHTKHTTPKNLIPNPTQMLLKLHEKICAAGVGGARASSAADAGKDHNTRKLQQTTTATRNTHARHVTSHTTHNTCHVTYYP